MGSNSSLRWLVLALAGAGLLWAAPSVAAAAEARILKGPYVVHVAADSAVVRFETDAAGSQETAELEVLGAGPAAHLTAQPSAFHSFQPRGLVAAHRYEYRVVVGATERRGSFVTAPAMPVPYTFLVYGDNRTDDPAHAAVAKAVMGASGDFLLNTGDLVEEGSSPGDWQRFFDIEAGMLAKWPIFSCVGNHELHSQGGVEYARYFGVEGTDEGGHPFFNSTFRWGGVRFFLLNSMTGWTGTKDRAWLETELAKADQEPGLDLRVVVMHHGLYSSGPHGNNTRMIDAGLPALFRAHGVDLLLAGHDHLYERGYEDGLRYVVTGGGGAPSYAVKNPRAGMRKAESTRHFIEARVEGAAMRLTVRRVDGSLLETCGFRKSRSAWDCDPPAVVPAPAPTAPPGRLPPPSPPRGCSCEAGASGGAPSGLPASFALVLGALAFRTRRTRQKRL
jgi:predicted phosphodiesterase